MSNLLPLVALTLPLTLAAVACASADEGGTSSGTSPTPPDATQAATPVNATPAVEAPDQEAYRMTVAGLGTVQETCTYMAETSVADCTDRGIYKLEPPPEDEDASCVVGLSGGGLKPEYVLCSNPDGEERKFFVIQP